MDVFSRSRQCPGCGSPLTPTDIRPAGAFPCPACGILLVASEYYPLYTLIASLSFSVLVFAGLGLWGVRLFRALILAFIPVLFTSANFFKYVILPKIEPYETTLRLKD
jgi:hypothetical protein